MGRSGAVRLATLQDAPAIAHIYNQAIDRQRTADMDHVDAESRLNWLSHHEDPYSVFVFEDGKRVLGWLSISAYRPGRRALRLAAEVSYYVDYEFHGRGIGTALMEKAIQHGTEDDLSTLFAILLEDNEASIALLQKFGFDRWGRLPLIADFDGRKVGQVYYGRNLDTGGSVRG